ncbi:Ig-like domain-containing protein [Methylobacterium bullatum]|uniref:Metallopeptidase AprA n=1 Tax=Methylobacterium bullatum TaxID=570505 RepID=A0A679JRY6_9HYPH|nr:Metallopeptidase AprA [Methylobacterium bullatum]
MASVVSIVAAESVLNATANTTEVTFTFDEAVTGFDSDDVVISEGAGTMGDLTSNGSGTVWKGLFTASPGFDGQVTMSVTNDYFNENDDVGEAGGELESPLTIDQTAPTVTVELDSSAFSNTNPTSQVTVTLSEASPDFDASFIVVTGGTIDGLTASDDGLTYIGTVTANANSTTPVSVSVAAGRFTDAAGNANAATISASDTATVDTVDPTVSLIEVVASDLNVTSNTTEVTFTFSEEVKDFDASDVSIADGAGEIGTLTGSNGGKTWTGTFTAAEGFAGSTTLSVTGYYADLASNPGSEGYTQTLSIDTRAPTVLIDLDRDAFTIGNGTSEVTFTLSEPSPNFDKADVTVTGGTISDLTANGLIYTGTFTANPNSTAPVSISVAAGAFVDYSGNANTASTPDTATVDTVAPTVSVNMPADTFNILSPTSEVTFILSEASDNFDKSDVTVTGGSIGDLTASVDGLTYTGTFTAEEDSTAPVTILVDAGAFTDAAGNANTPSNLDTATVDTVAPTVEINILAATLNVNVPDVTVTFTLSEASINFNRTDVTVTGGSIGDLTASADGLTYTGTVTADEGFTGELSVSVAAERFNDAAANGNAASLVDTATVDMVAPTVTVALAADSFNIANRSSEVTFTLSEASTDFPGSDFDASDVTVVGGSIGELINNGDGTYTGTVSAYEDSTTQLSISVAAGAFGDTAGNSNTVSNSDTATVDTVAPTVVSIVAADTELNSASNSTLVTFTFSEAVTGFAKDDVLVTGPGLLGDLETTNGGLTWTGTFTASAGQTGSATLAVSGAYLDAASNPGAAGGLETLTIDTQAPMVTVNLASTAFSNTNPTSQVTFTLTEAATDFDKSDVTITGGSIGDLTASDGGMTYTGTVTANPNSTTPVSVSVGLGRFTDAAGNANLGSVPDTATVDTQAPTVTSIVAVDADLNLNDTTEVVTFTFSEAVTGFTASDVFIPEVSGLPAGTLGTLISSNGGTTWTGTFTAQDGFVGSANLSVIGEYADLASNVGSTGGSKTLNIDTVAPTVTVDLASTAFSATNPTSAVTITLSEISAGFDKTAVTVNGGTLSDLTASLDGLTYTGFVTADQNSTEPVSIYVSAGAFTDVAGNANAPSMSDNATVDTVNPTVALLTISQDTGASDSDHITRDRTLSVSGTVEAGSTVTVAVLDLAGNPVLVNGTAVTLVATVTGGIFTTAPTASLPDGSYIFRATATDSAGNTTISDLNPVRVDNSTILPTFGLAEASDTGVSATDLLTNSTTPSFTGTAEAGATVQLFLDGSEIGTAVADPNGRYTLAFADSDLDGTPLTDGSYSLTALVTDLAGNTKLSTTVKTFTVDATAPTATVVIADASLDDGNMTSKVTFSFTEAVDPASLMVNTTGGGIEPGSLVVAQDGLSATATFIADDNSTTAAKVTLTAFKDLAGNAGTSTASTAVPVDTVNPTVGIAFAETSFSDDNRSSTVTFTFSEAFDPASLKMSATGGSIEPGSLFVADDGRSATVTFTADDDSTTDAKVTLTAFKDLVGNAGTSTASAAIPVDTVNPTATVVIADDSFSDGNLTSTVTFTFSEAVDPTSLELSATGGTVDPDSIVIAVDGLSATATFTATDDSTTDAKVTLTAFKDLAGNAGTSTPSAPVTVDTVNPTVQIAFSETSLSDGIPTSTVTFTFSEAVNPDSLDVRASGGIIEPGSLVLAEDGLSATATFTATDNSVADASVTLLAFKDLAGNFGTSTPSAPVTVDTVNPTATVVIGDGSFSDGNLTSTVTFTFSEAVDPASLVVNATGGIIEPGSLVVAEDGRSATVTFTADDDSVVDAKVTLTAFKDLVGNAGTSTASAPVTVDTVNPTATVVIADDSFSDGNLTSTVTFTFSEAVDPTSLELSATGGTVDPDSIVIAVDGLSATATFTATDDSTTDAKVTLTAFKDLAGNAGTSTPSAPVTVDTVNPKVTSITAADDSLNVEGRTTTVSFTFSEAVKDFSADDVTFDAAAGSLGTLTSDDGITWTGEFTAKTGFAGQTTLSVGGSSSAYTDLAGNTGQNGGSLGLTIDTVRPTIGGLTISTDNGVSSTDNITRDNTLTVSGSVTGVAENATVEVAVIYDGETVTTLTGTVIDGTFITNVSPILASPGAAGREYTFSASVKDASGNIATESFNVTIDRATTVATIGLASGSDLGVPGDGITSTATPDFFGIAEAGATVDVFLNDELIGTTLANESGQFTMSFLETGLQPLTNGTYTLTTSSTDIAGNTKQSTLGTSFTVDRTAPTATITLSDTSLVAGETATVTITFSEAVTGLGRGDFVVGNGELGELSGPTAGPNGSVVYTATLTPAANSEDSSNVVTLSTTYTDVAGNTGSTASTGNYAVDTRAPTVLSVAASGPGITDGAGTLVTGQTVSFTFTMSEAVAIANGGALAITLSNGATALYNPEESTSTKLVFDYTVLVDQIASDLAITGVSLNGASIADLSGNPFDVSASAVDPAGTLNIDGYTGTSGSETFRGTIGAERFTGLGGDDTYLVDNIGDETIEAVGGGYDTVRTSVGYSLMSGQEIEALRGSGTVGLVLTGNEFDNRIVGTSGNDVIDGKAGVDALFGGLGDDVYYVDNVGDQVTEAAQAGSDTVRASVSYTLKAGQEIETLEGSGSTGLTLTGNNFANTIVGTAGNDILDGKTGADTLSGGAGNDTYYVDNANDRVIETTGTDTVYASVSYALESGVSIEALRAFGSKGLTLTGNELANTIVGGAAKDVIVGGLGQDTLTGGAGNDTFVFKTVSDSGNGAANRDVILDFKVGADHIDLSGIQAVSGAPTDQSFSFIEGAFGKHKGELHAVASGSSTIIEGDVDGNGKADFQIVLRNTIEALHATDFVL